MFTCIQRRNVFLPGKAINIAYIGQTNNIENREKQQLHKTLKAAKFIKEGDDFKLVYQEEYATRLESIHRELQLKGL